MCRTLTDSLQNVAGRRRSILLPTLLSKHSRKSIARIKPTIDNLTQEVTALKVSASPINEVINPLGSSPKPEPDIQSTPVVSVTNRQTQSATTAKTFDKADDKAQGDRKFNVVIYGIKECSKGTPRNEQLTHNLDKVISIVTEGENSINPYLFVFY